MLSPGNITCIFSCFHKLPLLLESAGVRMKKGLLRFDTRKISVKPCTRDNLYSPEMAEMFFICDRFSSLSQSLSLQQHLFLPGQRVLRYQQEQPFPLPHFSFTPAAIPLPLESVIFSCQRERNDKSIQRKNREIPSLVCDIKKTIHMIFIFVTLVLLSPSCLLLSLSMLLLLLGICF